MMSIYTRPFPGPQADEFYPVEPTDEQANVLARAIAHWIVAYLPDERDRTAQSIVLDILEANGASAYPLERDEAERIAAAVGVELPDEITVEELLRRSRPDQEARRS